MARAFNSFDSPVRARGWERLRRVYEELYTFLGDSYSPAELLKAAQALIDVSEKEYSAKRYQDGVRHPGYYSHEVDWIISTRAWWVLENERTPNGVGDEWFSVD